MSVSIRRVRPGDEAALAYIQTESWKAAFRDILDRETLERCTDLSRATGMYRRLLEEKKGNGYLLTLDGAAHGIAWWDAARDAEMAGKAELICIHSLPGHWRQGYGGMMMERVLSDVALARYPAIVLWVFAENTRARRFYEAKGFHETGLTKNSRGAVELCYQKEL